LVFSSSATVYGVPQFLPYTEQHPLSATNTYGQTKLAVENMLRDVYRSDPEWRFAILRYFNPVGAHPSGRIGEDPQGVPNNLMPFVAQVAVGRREFLNVWGDDYPTPDGTGVRDYIHVVDLALGHVKAVQFLERESGCNAINLGSGVGHSVLDLVRSFERVSGQAVPLRMGPRRSGDVAASWADPTLAMSLLGWSANSDLDGLCADTWNWQTNNPNGYKGEK